MAEVEWEVVDEVVGILQAEILRGLLEAQGIQAWLSQEGVGHSIYPVNISPLGKVQILAPAGQSQAARQILSDYYAGKLETDEPDASSGEELEQDAPDNDQG